MGGDDALPGFNVHRGFIGCVPWVFLVAFIGQQAAEEWTSWKDSLHYFDYAVAACIVLGVIYLLVRSRRNRGGGSEAAADAAPS